MATLNSTTLIKNKQYFDRNNLSILTFNLHGYNQGGNYLKEICNTKMHDFIFVQEHWLIPSELYKLKSLSNEYVLFGKSAMKDILGCSVLWGRPFGGVSILL